MSKSTKRCAHKGCIHKVRVVLPKNDAHNQLGKKHECCGRCCKTQTMRSTR